MAVTEIERLIQLLSRVPGLGPRSARRAVLFLMNKRETQLIPLIQAMQQVSEHVRACPICGNMDTEVPCHICSDPKREKNQICVVQDVADLWAFEHADLYKGQYHVLGGVLSALDGIGPDELNIASLVARVQSGGVDEIVFALPATVDGQTTVHYLVDRLSETHVKMTTLSRGVPLGGELDYLDDGTIQMAFKSRRDV